MISESYHFNKADTSQDRLLQMLCTAIGPHMAAMLDDPQVVEVMLNPDGRLWVDRLGKGRSESGYIINPADAQRIIEIVASSTNAICNEQNPILSAELPGSGSRFQGLLPPVVKQPSFTIRKKALMIFTLDNYVEQGIMTESQKEKIIQAVKDKKNILIVGVQAVAKRH
jgi:type IV secretion system protein VirB11